ncbi:MAG: putative cAMP-binding protein [Bacteroidetes bacterium]|jgi:CRP-like cAMP-binding protein|nr:putative cAMP-binding protein [Bacteroidota bacterium]
MDQNPFIQLIRNSASLPEQSLAVISEQFEKRELKKNELFLEAGKVSNEYLVLADGAMRAFTRDADGDEVTTGLFLKNRIVMEVASFFMRIPSQETIQALADSTGYVITFEKLNMLFHAIPEFREFGRGILVKEFATFKQRTLGLINQSAEERYAELIRMNPEIFHYAQLKHIASYLGITDTSLSRIRKEFSKK